MRPPRFTIASLLRSIVFVGVGVAALRSPSQLWANAWFSIALVLLTAAVIAAVYRRGKQRAFWVGFATCGWVYGLLALGPWVQAQAGPYLLTTAVLEILYEHFEPPSPAVVIFPPPTSLPPPPEPPSIPPPPDPPSVEVIVPPPVPVNAPPAPVMVGIGGGTPGGPGMMGGMGGGLPEPSRWAAWTAPDDSTGEGESIGNVSLNSPQTFRRIGHCLFCLILAFAGGVLTRRLYLTREEPEIREVR